MPMPPQMPPQSSFLGAAQQGGGMPMPPMGGGAQPSQQPQGLPPEMMAMLKQVAAMGRGGDTMLAHLTPGEKTVPPEVQTPKVLAVLDKAYKDKGVTSEQFTVGSPQSSVNPATGLNEYNFMSAFLPAALGLAGSFMFPALAPGLMSAAAGGSAAAGTGLSALAGSSIGSGLGATAGGLLAGKDPGQALLSGALGGAGGYGLGSLMGSAAPAAAQAAGNVGPTAANAPSLAGISPEGLTRAGGGIPGIMPAPGGLGNIGPTVANAANIAPQADKFLNPEWTKLGGFMKDGFNPMQAAGSVAGSVIGDYLGAPPKPYNPRKPSGFDDKMRPVSELPPWNEQLGQTTYNGPQASFSGYNPMTNFPAAWRFY